MANGLLKKLALAGVVGASAIFSAKEAKADPISWQTNTPSENILLWSQFLPISTYSVGSVNIVNDYNSQQLPSDFSWGLICVASMYGGESDVCLINGTGASASGKYSSPDNIQTAFSGGMWYQGVIDFDGDGKFGDYDPSTGVLVVDSGDGFMGNISVGFNSGVLTVDGHYYRVPEPSTGVLTALSLSDLLFGGSVDRMVGQSNSISDSSGVTSNSVIPYAVMERGYIFEADVHVSVSNTNAYNQCGYYLLGKSRLDDPAWSTNSFHTVTGSVNRIYFTNYNPQGFFKVVESSTAVPAK